MPAPEGFVEVKLLNWEELEQKFSKSREYMYGAVLMALRRIGHILVPALKEKILTLVLVEMEEMV